MRLEPEDLKYNEKKEFWTKNKEYCKTGNFRLYFNFAKFANFVNSRKLSARESLKVDIYEYIPR